MAECDGRVSALALNSPSLLERGAVAYDAFINNISPYSRREKGLLVLREPQMQSTFPRGEGKKAMKPQTPALLFPLAAVAAGLLPVLWLAAQNPHITFDPYLWHVLRFTLMQATLSTLLAVTLGVAFGRALFHTDFPGRNFLVQLLSLPLALPAIVVVLGLVSIFGANGILGGTIKLYGLTGILLAHIFFNFPLAARLALAALQSIPDDSFRLAAQLNFSHRDEWRHLEWPALRSTMPAASLLIFLLCAASFTIVLTLGGGPQATTLEVAIYQALRFDFDPARAAMLSILQIMLCTIVVWASLKFPGDTSAFPTLRLTQKSRGAKTTMFDGMILIAGCLLLLPPLAAIIVDGLSGFAFGAIPVIAALTSLVIGVASALLCLLIVWPLASSPNRATSTVILAALILPPAVIATGWFILLNRFSSSNMLIAGLVIALNSLMALPFAYNALQPAMRRAMADHDRLCASLGITGRDRFRHIEWPVLRRPATLAFILAMIVSLGDLTAILLFGSGSIVTLPALIHQQMGSYHFNEAAFSALLLAALATVLLIAAQKLSHDRP